MFLGKYNNNKNVELWKCYYQWPTSNYANLQNQKGQNCEPKLECETPKLTQVLSYQIIIGGLLLHPKIVLSKNIEL